MIRAIVFDFGQTLVDSADGFRQAEKELQLKARGSLGPSAGVEFLDLYREIRASFQARSDFSRKAILETLFLRHGRTPDSALLERWETEYWERVKGMTRMFPEVPEVLLALRTGGYRLAVITNAQGQRQEGQHRFGNHPELAAFFETIIVAGEAGVPAKPDPVPFCLCLERLGLRPEEAVYVGDDWRIDVCGSKAVSMHPVWLQHRLVTRNWPVVETAVPVIGNLERLLDIEKLLAAS